MADKTIKTVLVLIALGVWVNALVAYRAASAASDDVGSLGGIEFQLGNLSKAFDEMKDSVDQLKSDVSDIGDGTCTNGFICR